MPHWPDIKTDGLFPIMAVSLVIDIIVIPWIYLYRNYIKKSGDRWK